jgi:hypothetical protein
MEVKILLCVHCVTLTTHNSTLSVFFQLQNILYVVIRILKHYSHNFNILKNKKYGFLRHNVPLRVRGNYCCIFWTKSLAVRIYFSFKIWLQPIPLSFKTFFGWNCPVRLLFKEIPISFTIFQHSNVTVFPSLT